MDTTLRILGLALAFGFITALIVFVVSKFKVT